MLDVKKYKPLGVPFLTNNLHAAVSLLQEGGNVQVLDAKKLGRETQSKIMDKLLKEGTSDNFEMLTKIRKRLHK